MLVLKTLNRIVLGCEILQPGRFIFIDITFRFCRSANCISGLIRGYFFNHLKRHLKTVIHPLALSSSVVPERCNLDCNEQ